ncbi:MAG: preprotein translocase subunit SecB [Candidatus Tokpelaia sp. JSC161]|jgi:preprotein translocase subunit SecB|nr:MAG: preprotein translocase subunit SecB [Candidatus Tokpelaia sp. JSC161]
MAESEAETPLLNVLTQYIKDLSFESPTAPYTLRAREKALPINSTINVNANTIGEDTYTVLLTMSAQAGEEKELIFNIELIYGGLFKICHSTEKTVLKTLFIECPQLLFPFARQIIADTVRNAGFPPLMIDPIDFNLLFQNRSEKEKTLSAHSANSNCK